MKFKVLSSSILAASMLLSVSSAYADSSTFVDEVPTNVEPVDLQALYSYYEFKVSPDKMIYSEEMAAMKPATKEEIQAEIDKLADEFNATLTPEDQQRGQQLYQTYTNIYGEPIESQSVVDYDKFYNELRKANYIETILDINEGLTDIQIAKIGGVHATKARNLALEKYPSANHVMLRDGYRHFGWNYLSTKDVGAVATRKATNNHEWGLALLDPVLNYYDQRIAYHTNKGSSAIAFNAFNDTTMWIPHLKQNMIFLCEGSYSFFKGFFTVANIMDFHNNVYGRAYAATHPSGLDPAYNAARVNLDIVLNEASVKDFNYQLIYNNDWYNY